MSASRQKARLALSALAHAAVVATLGMSSAQAAGLPHQLTGWAALSDTFRWEGPTSGQFIGGALGVTPPFSDSQPIPGFSALLKNADGSWTGMADNGFGTKGNSGDFLIGLYNVGIQFRTAGNGSSVPGAVSVNSRINFNDAKGYLKDGQGVDLKITADFANYQTVSGNNLVDSGKAVDSRIRNGRLLTGFDFDVESIARAKDGSYFVGEEFGPYILHFDAQGTLMSDPVAHPFLKSPSNPLVMNNGAQVTSQGSRGFESLAFNGDQSRLWAVPEAAPTVAALRPVANDERYLNFFEFDPAAMAYTGHNLVYKKDGPQTGNNIVIGDMTNVGGDKFVLIERDSKYGSAAEVKRLYLVDLNEVDETGTLKKTLLVDLLHVNDPLNIGGPLATVGGSFSMPFDSIESVVVLDNHTLAVAIDTNYPDEDGRLLGKPDSTEIITIRFDQQLFAVSPVPEPGTYALMLGGLALLAGLRGGRSGLLKNRHDRR
ncbi:esterase-like activity of phytase family protein [uncultured Aquincola sp.]|uniref:esterase-like activity of phytase family protein n=1 Tax=uncultured Aquincola sp. TaxID=886556 RepID=UPI0032B22473